MKILTLGDFIKSDARKLKTVGFETNMKNKTEILMTATKLTGKISPFRIYNQIEKPNIFISNNRFSILKCDDYEKYEAVEYICDQIQKANIAKRNKKKRKVIKNKKTIRHDKKGKYKLTQYYNAEKLKARQNSSEGYSPTVLRCNGCWNIHFPGTNRFCRWYCSLKKEMENTTLDKDMNSKVFDDKILLLINNHVENLEMKELPRLRGGMVNNNSVSLLISQAIENASKHGINLAPGVKNNADGNCAFDAVLNNINKRKCFHEKLDLPSHVYRQVWITELEMESKNFPELGAGYTDEEKSENWNRLKHSGTYEIDFFGDFVIHAIAKGCKKTILIFNTSTDASSPIYVIEPNKFGGLRDSEIPVVIGYNQVHYESLHPITQEDIEKTKLLVKSYTNGTYTFKKNDIKFLISRHINTKKNERTSPGYIVENIDPRIEDEIKDLLKIKPAARTIAQKKRIKHLYNQKNKDKSYERKKNKRENINVKEKAELIKKAIDRRKIRNKDIDNDKKNELRNKDNERKQKQRAHQTPEQKLEESLKNIERKQIQRTHQTPEQKLEESLKNIERKQKRRTKQTDEQKIEESLKNKLSWECHTRRHKFR